MNIFVKTLQGVIRNTVTTKKIDQITSPLDDLELPTNDHRRVLHVPDNLRTRKVWLFGPTQALGQIDFLTARRIAARHPGFDYNIRENKRPMRGALHSILDMIPIIVAASVIISVVNAAFGKPKPALVLQDAVEGKK